MGSQLDKPRLFLVATNRVHVNTAVIINAIVLYILVFMYLLEIKLLLLLLLPVPWDPVHSQQTFVQWLGAEQTVPWMSGGQVRCHMLYILRGVRLNAAQPICCQAHRSSLTGAHVSISWWRHQMVTFSALPAIYAGNSPVPGEFPHKGQ